MNDHNPNPTFLEKVNSIIDYNMDADGFSVQHLSEELGMSRMQVHRKLKAATNLSTSHYIRQKKMEDARELLISTGMSITQIAYEVGFSDPAYFSRCFHEYYGECPSGYRDNHY